jgi:hypothetical protein
VDVNEESVGSAHISQLRCLGVDPEVWWREILTSEVRTTWRRDGERVAPQYTHRTSVLIMFSPSISSCGRQRRHASFVTGRLLKSSTQA